MTSCSNLQPRLARAAAGFAALAALSWVAPAPAQVPSVGLSTVRSQRFHNENLLGFYTPQTGDQFGWAVAVGDFNADGADDLASSIVWDDGLTDSPVTDSGSVVVRFGVPGVGLADHPASTVLRQVPYRNPAEAGDAFGGSLASCDFNGDGRDDLAVGVPGEDHVDRVDAGAVQIHYGSSELGINFNPEDFFAQSSPGIPGSAEDGDVFGQTLACGDFDADGFSDLAVGTPNENLPAFIEILAAGIVVIVPGSPFGLDHQAAFELSQDVDGVDGDAEYPDSFGQGLATGDYNGDGFDDLVVGSPGEDYKGALHVFFGGPSGLSTSGSLFWMETFIGGSSESGDYFAGYMTSGDFDGDDFDDLAVGIPGDDLGLEEAQLDAGRVAVLYGGRFGFDRARTQFWSELEILGPADSEIRDTFGMSFAAGDFDKDGFADLAIGHPGEALAGPGSGQVTILLGSANGLTDARTREIAAGLEGFPGSGNQGDQRFASALAAGDFDGDGHADLAIGIPEDDVDGNADVGSELVLYGSLFSDGVDNGDASFWSAVQSSSVGNQVLVSNAARLGPTSAGRFGLEFVVADGTPRGLPAPSFVRADSDRGFNGEPRLTGSFFIDPQDLQMVPVAGQNVFQFMAFDDGVDPGSRTWLAFDLVRTANDYALVANFFNQVAGTLQFGGSARIASAGDPNGHNTKFDFEWTAGNPGQLTMWRTSFPFGAPDAAGRVQLFSVPLPGTAAASIRSVRAGVVTGQDLGTFGRLYLDELSFRR